jgi:hypothetical protein
MLRMCASAASLAMGFFRVSSLPANDTRLYYPLSLSYFADGAFHSLRGAFDRTRANIILPIVPTVIGHYPMALFNSALLRSSSPPRRPIPSRLPIGRLFTSRHIQSSMHNSTHFIIAQFDYYNRIASKKSDTPFFFLSFSFLFPF